MMRDFHFHVSGKNNSGSSSWWQDAARWSRLVEESESAGLSFDGWFGVSEGHSVQLRDREEIGAWAAALPLGDHSLRRDPEDVIGTELILKIGWPEEEAGVKLILRDQELDRLHPGLPSGLLGFANHSIGWLSEHGIFPGVFANVSGLNHACLRPSRTFPPFGGGVDLAPLVVGYDRRTAELTPDERQSLERVASAELPQGVQRWDDGHMLLLQWVSSLADLDEARRQLARRELWLQQLGLPWKRQSGYNEYGDYLDGPMMFSEPLEPFTFYSPGRKWGYKAVVPTEDGGLDEEAVAALRPLLRAGRARADRELQGMTFIAPDRDAAVRLLPAAKAFGARSVWYPHTSKGCYWDIDPPGNWLPPDAALGEADSPP